MKVNGYTVIASHEHKNGNVCIVGMRDLRYEQDVREYVYTTLEDRESVTWGSGRYSSNLDETLRFFKRCEPNPHYTTKYFTYIDGVRQYEGDDLQAAINAWTAGTFDANRSVPGGVTVQQFSGDTMVRDGWIFHVHNDGTVYVTRGLREA